MQTRTDVSNMANVILESLYLLFVCFEMARPEMSKIHGVFLGLYVGLLLLQLSWWIWYCLPFLSYICAYTKMLKIMLKKMFYGMYFFIFYKMYYLGLFAIPHTYIHSLHTNNLTRFSWEPCAPIWISHSLKADSSISKSS